MPIKLDDACGYKMWITIQINSLDAQFQKSKIFKIYLAHANVFNFTIFNCIEFM